MSSLTLYIHFHELVVEYPLPAGNNRRIQVNIGEMLDMAPCNLSFEVWDRVWHVLSGGEVALSVEGTRVADHILSDGDVINGAIAQSGMAFTIVVRALNEEQARYEKFSLGGKSAVTIGNDEAADIVIRDAYASKRHAVLTRQGDSFVLTDHSKNGTYLNNRRVTGETRLEMMDLVYIMGVKIIFMGDFLAINQPALRAAKLGGYLAPAGGVATPAEDKPLIRAPRFLEPLDAEAVEIEGPPAAQRQRKNPLIFILGPSITMPIPILVSTLLNSARNAGGGGFFMGTIASVGISALLGAVWALAHHFYNKKVAKEEEDHRTGAYLRYIENNDRLLAEKHRYNAGVLAAQHLSLQEFLGVLEYNASILWNRNVNQQDFLAVRLGLGPVALPGPIQVPKQRFSLVDDPLESEPHKLLEKHRLMGEAVSLIRLGDTKIVGVLGEDKALGEIARVMALQTAALHSYTDVKLAFLLGPEDEKRFSWARWLPHVRTPDHKMRLICLDESQRQNVLFYLSGNLRTRMEQQREEKEESRQLPHFVIFCTSPDYINNEGIYQYMADNTPCGATFVLLYGMLDRLPNECTHIIQTGGEFVGYYRMDEARAETNKVRFDRISSAEAEQLARRIGAYVVAEQATGEIPASISFLEMYGIGRVEQWDLFKRWKENRAYESMRALMGIGGGGKPQYLDIHEKQHGPHGLMAGTTGSGKSETIQTYILSLAMNFHPHEIALILIDYKGGGMANAFLDLPHLAGTITNLDGNQTLRALVSIKGEIKRRQALFNEYKVNHIDLYARLFREGRATEPMPHLIIISDEFAELKKEQPEFIKELVSTARVGRSLGVHLILATQKPSGVVDDEIWSNSRFKICLRVQDKQDSNEMLKRPDAAYLTQTGRAYMQIGNDEIFEMFQSGYSGAYYEPSDQMLSAQDSEVTMIGLDGSPLVMKAKKRVEGGSRITQLDACVAFIRKMADENGVENVRRLWLPELAPGLTLTEIPPPEEGRLVAVAGLADNPARQEQAAASIDFGAIGNLMVAGVTGSGKSTLLQTMLFSLVSRYPAEEVIFYCLDFSSTLLRVFAGLPHCGGVVGPEDGERIARLFQLLRRFTAERRKLFDGASVGGFDEYRRVSAEPLPAVLLVLDNYFAFAERYPELEEEVDFLARDGAKFGIHLVVSVSHLSDMKYKQRQNFTTTLPLLLSERGDYMEALGVMPEFMPSAVKGRGLFGGAALEFQAALAIEGENEQARAEAMKRVFAGLPAEGLRAPEIRFIPREEPYGDYLAKAEVKALHQAGESLCIGYQVAEIDIAAIPLGETYCYPVSAANAKALENMMQNLLAGAEAVGGERHMVCLRSNRLAKGELDGLYRDADGVYALLVRLKEEFTKRSALRKGLLAENPDADTFGAIRREHGLVFVFIDNMSDFIAMIYDKQVEDFSAIVELFWKQGKGLGIYFLAGFDQGIYSTGGIYKAACKTFVEHGGGIHLGGRLDQQKLFEVAMPMSEQMKPREITQGYTVEDGAAKGIFIPLDKAGEQ